MIQVHAGDSTTAIGETLHKQGRRPNRQSVRRGRARQPGDLGDSARFLPAAHRDSGGHGGKRARRSREPGRQAGHSRGPQLDDTTGRQDQRGHAGIFTLDLARPAASSSTVTSTASRSDDLRSRGRKDPAGVAFGAAWAVASVTAMGNDHRRIEGLIAPGTWNVDPSASPQDILSSLIGASAAAVREGGPAGHRDGDEHVAVQHPDGRLAGAAGVQAAGLREGGAGHLQPAGRAPQAGVRLDGELSAGPPRGGHHRRRPRAAPRRGIPTPPTDLPATPICSPGTDALKAAEHPDAGRLAVLRHHRPAGHDVVHPRLPTASGEHRVGQAQRCPRQWRPRRAEPTQGGGARFADRTFALTAAAPGRLPGAGPGRLDLRAHRVRCRRITRRW